MNTGNFISQNKRKERVKSIFDSDDSDEDSDKGFGHSNSNDDDDDDDDLRKKIDEVCFNLSNEEEKFELGNVADNKVNELNIPMPTFTMDEVTRANVPLDSKIDDGKETNVLEHQLKISVIPEIEETNKLYEPSSTYTLEKFDESSTSKFDEKRSCLDEIENLIDKPQDTGVIEAITKECETKEEDLMLSEEEEEEEERNIIHTEDNEVVEEICDKEENENIDDTITSKENNEDEEICEKLEDESDEEIYNKQENENIDDLITSKDTENHDICERQENENIDDIITSKMHNKDDETSDKEENEDLDDIITSKEDTQLNEYDNAQENKILETLTNKEDMELRKVDHKCCETIDTTPNTEDVEMSEIEVEKEIESLQEISAIPNKEDMDISDTEDNSTFANISKDTLESEHSVSSFDEANEMEQIKEPIIENVQNASEIEDLQDTNVTNAEDISQKIMEFTSSPTVNKSFSFTEDSNDVSDEQPVIASTNDDITEELSKDDLMETSCEATDHKTFQENFIENKDSAFDKLKLDQVNEVTEERNLVATSIPRSSSSEHIGSPNRNLEEKIVSEVILEKDKEEEEMETDQIKTEIESKSTDFEAKSPKKNETEIFKESSKDSEIADLSDVWNTVSIFQTSKHIPEIDVKSEVKPDVSAEFHDSDSDSGADVSDKVESNLQTFQTSVEINPVRENINCADLTIPVIKDNTNSPWEAMKNGSLFEDIQDLQEQSPDYQLAESLKRKKVRVEDVFTDSEGEETTKKIQKIKISLDNSSAKIQTEGDCIAKKNKQKRERATSINLPAIMLAFEKGWIREVVYRSSAGIANKRADIYYYSPTKRKLRSRIELEEYLAKNNITDLNLQNFSFFKEPLGVEEKYEKIRLASHIVKLGDSSAISPGLDLINSLPKKRIRKPTTKVKDSPPAKKAKTKEVLKKVMIKEAVTKSSPASAKRKISITGPRANCPIPNSDSPVYATHLYPANPPLTQTRILTPVVRGEAKERTFHCTPACEAGGGNVPNLQCVKCVCLFHSECCQMPPQTVSIILSSMAKFLCPNCYREENITSNYLEPFKPSACFEPLAFDPSSESEDEGLVSDFEHPSYTRIRSRPRTPPLPPLPPMFETSKQFSSICTPNINVPMLQSANTAQSSSSYSNQQTQYPHLLPNLPVAVPIPSSTVGPTTSFLLYQPITSKNAVFQPPTVVPASHFTYKMPPPQSGSSTVMSQQQMPTSPANKSVAPKGSEAPKVPQVIAGVRGGADFLMDMSAVYQVIRKIFTYLSVPDLLIVSRVCTLWRDLALSPYYWNVVRLRNVCIKDWDKMVEFLNRRGTYELDLRKMVIHAGFLEQNQHLFVTEDVLPSEDDDMAVDKETLNLNDQPPDKDTVNIEKEEANEIGTVTEDLDKMDVSMDKINEKEEKMEYTSREEPIREYDSDVHVGSPRKDISKNEQNVMHIDEKEVEEPEEKVHEIRDEQEEEMKLTEEERLIMEKKLQEDTEELKRKVKEEKEQIKIKENIVHSVLNEHDYFGRIRTDSSSSSSSNSSSNSSSSSDSGSGGSFSESSDSESQMDVVGEEIENSFQKLQEKMNDVLPPDEVEPLKPLQEIMLSQQETEQTVVDKPSEENNPPKSPNEKKDESKESTDKNEESQEQNREEVQMVSASSPEKTVNREWEYIASTLGKLKSVRKLLVGTYDSSIVEIILSKCHQLTSFNSLNFGSQTDSDSISFDPSVLMQTRNLEELRLTSQKSFTFKSNFNFIKLPRLKVLMLKGLRTTDIGWPYLGIHLTHLYLSSINTFSHNNWTNISSMTNLVELELNGSGSDHDAELCMALGKLSNLSRLILLDWNIGSKLPHTLKRLHNIKYFYVIPAVENENMRGVFAGRLMVVLESTKHLDEFIWGIQPQNIIMEELAGEKIFILNMKAGKETGSVEGEEVRSVAIDSLKGFVKCRIPRTRITVKKVSSNLWTWSAGE